MASLSHHEIIILLLQLSTMLISGKILGEIAKRFKQPAVIGEILAGIILGPTVLGTLFPETMIHFFPKTGNSPIALHGLTSVSVILLLLIAGLEVELSLIFAQGKRAVSTSLLGILIPFILGFFAPYIFPNIFNILTPSKVTFALFLGTALSISALPVIARTLMDIGLFKSTFGMLIISSAMIDDFLGWMIFSVILGMINHGINTNAILFTIIATITFALFMLTIGRKIIDRTLPWINNQVSFPGGILAFAITMGFLGAAFTESIGIHAIFGSFIVGIALGDSIHMSSKTKEIIHDFVTNIFAPLFFVSIGLKVNFIANFDILLVSVIMLLSFVGKLVGCGLGAYIGGMNKRLSLAVGFGMNARGAMEIILATLALQAGVIDQYLFVALVVMALLTSMTSGYMMRILVPAGMQVNNEPNGVILMGNSEVSDFIGKYLTSQKIPVLITDTQKPKLNGVAKNDITYFQGDILQKGMIERLDLGKYGIFIGVSENDEINLKSCKLFAHEFGEEKAFRLITKKESQSASLSLPENILFRGIHWNFNAIQKILKKQPDIQVSQISFDSEASLNKFIAFNNNKKQVIPLFVQRGKRSIVPVSSFQMDIKEGDSLIYLDVLRQVPKSVKPKEEKLEKVVLSKQLD